MEENERERCKQTGKICYSRREAGSVLHSLKRIRTKHFHKKNVPKKIYLCEYCGCYHLTHIRQFLKIRKTLKDIKDKEKHRDWLFIQRVKRMRKDKKE